MQIFHNANLSRIFNYAVRIKLFGKQVKMCVTLNKGSGRRFDICVNIFLLTPTSFFNTTILFSSNLQTVCSFSLEANFERCFLCQN